MSNIIVFEDASIQKISNIRKDSICLKNITKELVFSFRFNHHRLLDFTIDFNYLNQINFFFKKTEKINVFFNNINGFSLENNSSKVKQKKQTLLASFIEPNLVFYENGQHLKTCSNLTFSASLFNTVYFDLLEFNRIVFKRAICPLIFLNASIKILSVWPVYDTFYLKNKIIFENFDTEINCEIRELFINKAIKLKIDENFLHKKVFKNIEKISLIGNIDQLNDKILIEFAKLKSIIFDAENFRFFAHKTSLKWLSSLNLDFKIDSNNFSQIKRYLKKMVKITISFSFSNLTSINHTFPEEDFCLYKDFPFDKMIFILFDNYPLNLKDNFPITCTAIWLIHKPFLYTIKFDLRQSFENTTFYRQFLKCQFENKKQLCFHNKKYLKINEISGAFIEYICFFLILVFNFGLLPLVSFIAMTLNCIIFYTISKLDIKNNTKIIKQFYYIKINALANVIICIIEIFRTIYTWPYIRGSDVWHFVFAQYFKIIFIEFGVELFKFCSSFSNIMFSIIRCSLIDNSNSFLYKCNEKSIVKFILIIGCIINSVKIYSYEINYFNPNFDYPMHKSNIYMKIHNINGFFWITIFNFLSDFMNYIFFMIIHFLLDIMIIIKLKKELRKKREKFPEKKLGRIVIKTYVMVILNTSINFLLRLPGILDLVYLNRQILSFIKSKNRFFAWILKFLIWIGQSYALHLIVIISMFSYVLSLITNFFLLYSYNTNLRKKINRNFKKWM